MPEAERGTLFSARRRGGPTPELSRAHRCPTRWRGKGLIGRARTTIWASGA